MKRELIYSGRVFRVERDEVLHRTGYRSVRECVVHDGGAVVCPVFANGDVLLIRQYRYPIDRHILEFPAGKLQPDEPPEKCALRELEEETGYRAARLIDLGGMYTTPGYSNEILYLFVARGLEPGAQNLESGEESITTVRVSFTEAEEMVRDGRIMDGKTIAALYRAKFLPEITEP
ncbi:MAG: NUDIX hydrolase [Chlorobi bacterium]|nr:NUDIX hydrolase [Chlorobiota bacterium]